MLQAIQLIQSVVSPSQVNAIVDWNKARNELALDSNLEINMLAEEAKEYFDATTFVKQVDAVGDLFYVAVGMLAKSAKGYNLASEGILSPIDFILTDFVGRAEAKGIEDIRELLSRSMDAIIEANNAKGTEKTPEGKVKKPDDFVPPEEKIAEIIKELQQEQSQQGKVVELFDPEDGRNS